MTRKYLRKPGTRRYVTYTSEELENCLELVANGTLNVIQASQMFGIPRRTLYSRISVQKTTNSGPKKYGGQTVFSRQEEIELAQHLTAIAGFGFSVTKVEMRSIVRDYLQKIGRVVPKFRNNLPGADWCDGFLQRNSTLNAVMAANKGSCVVNNPKVHENESKTLKPGKPKNRANLSKLVTNSRDDEEAEQSANNEKTETGFLKRLDRSIKPKKHTSILNKVLPMECDIVTNNRDETEESLSKRRRRPPKRFLL